MKRSYGLSGEANRTKISRYSKTNANKKNSICSSLNLALVVVVVVKLIDVTQNANLIKIKLRENADLSEHMSPIQSSLFAGNFSACHSFACSSI